MIIKYKSYAVCTVHEVLIQGSSVFFRPRTPYLMIEQEPPTTYEW